MRNLTLIISALFMLSSCQNEDDVENQLYKNRYEKRFIIYQDSLGTIIRDSGVVRVSEQNNIFRFDFEINNQSVNPLENIKMEMTGNNSLRNQDWTPSKLITLSKDNINIFYKDGSKYWSVNGITSF